MKTIDYSAIKSNAKYFKNILGKSKLCAVVKNDAYGHGLLPTATALAQIADCFAVGNAADAVAIKPVVRDVLALLPLNYRDTVIAVNAGAILTVDSFDTLDIVARVSKQLSIQPRVHIKIDSGMSRLGFTETQLNCLCGAIDGLKMRIEGVFSHFYGETSDQCDKQLQYFGKCADMLQSRVGRKLTRHIANTSAALLSSKYHLDMARVGLGLYGYGSDGLRPAAKVTANVISVKNVCSGSVVGYGAKYVCAQDTRLAVLDIGYADGLPRSVVGSAVKIGNAFCSIAAICMAMTVVDVGDADVRVGQTATLLGTDVNIANNQVIVYELLCNLK